MSLRESDANEPLGWTRASGHQSDHERIAEKSTPVEPYYSDAQYNIGLIVQQGRALRIRMHFQPQCLDTLISRGTLPTDANLETLRRFWVDTSRRWIWRRPLDILASGHAR